LFWRAITATVHGRSRHIRSGSSCSTAPLLTSPDSDYLLIIKPRSSPAIFLTSATSSLVDRHYHCCKSWCLGLFLHRTEDRPIPIFPLARQIRSSRNTQRHLRRRRLNCGRRLNLVLKQAKHNLLHDRHRLEVVSPFPQVERRATPISLSRNCLTRLFSASSQSKPFQPRQPHIPRLLYQSSKLAPAQAHPSTTSGLVHQY